MKQLFGLVVFLFFLSAANAQQPEGLAIGSDAPGFVLKDQSGNVFDLKETNKNKTVILIFYRGQWCPYCSKQLKGLQDSLGSLVDKGAVVAAVTPEVAENVQKTVEKTKASFPILSDDGLKVMNAYKVAFAVSAETVEQYKKYNIYFDKANGANGANLPVPALYIIKNGKIVWRYFDVDYRKRPTVETILQQL
jgi:peroxiredoxin